MLSRLIAIVALLALQPRPSTGQAPRQATTIDHDGYRAVLDRLFPATAHIGRDVDFVLTLRRTPSFDPESQIDIVVKREGSPIVQYAFVDHNVYYACNKLLETTPGHSPEVLAQKIPVKRRALAVPPQQLLRWQQDLFAGITSSLDERARSYFAGKDVVVLDGTSFDLWYELGTTRLNFHFDEALREGTLLNWAHRLFEEVLKLPERK
jgi:hypothetical protein